MIAVAALRDAARAGVSLRLVAGTAKVSGDVAPELLARLREHKAEIVEILSADRCCQCGEPLAWPGPVGIVLGDATAECQRCADAEVWRLLEGGGPRRPASARSENAAQVVTLGVLVGWVDRLFGPTSSTQAMATPDRSR